MHNKNTNSILGSKIPENDFNQKIKSKSLPDKRIHIKAKKERPFIRYHAVQAIVFSIVLLLLILLITIVTFLFGSISALIWFAMFWPAYDAYKGNYTKIPYITRYIRKRGWV